MKKQYINPTMKVVKLRTQHVLAVSQNASVVNTEQANENALGREYDFDE